MTLDLDKLEALRAKATPGEWRVIKIEQESQIWSGTYVGKTRDYQGDDAALIVAAVNALPALIARIRELEAEVKERRLGDIQMGKQWNGLQDLLAERDAEIAELKGGTDPWQLVEREGGTAKIEAGDWVRLRNGGECGPVSVDDDDVYPTRFSELAWDEYHKLNGYMEEIHDITHVRKAVKP